MRTKHYSEYVSHVAAMMGMASTDLGDTELGILNTFFDGAIKKIWRQTSWLENTRSGEYRVANNLLSQPNEFDRADWTQALVTVLPAVVRNPVDVFRDADLVSETVGDGIHKLASSVSRIVPTPHTLSIFAKPLGVNFLKAQFVDGASATHFAIFDLSNRAVVSTSASVTAIATNPGELWTQGSITFTPALGTGAVEFLLSRDGSTFSYAGDTSYGVFLWGASLIQNQAPGISTQLIPWDQSGYPEIDTIYEVFMRSPFNATAAGRVGYQATSEGIQLFGVNSSLDANYYAQSPQAGAYPTGAVPFGPVYLNYRTAVPEFSGVTFSTSATYAPGDMVYAPTASGGYDYFKCRVTSTGSGQSPASAPERWELQPIPYSFFEYICLDAFSEWLRTESQFAKSEIVAKQAQDALDRELDRQEREMGILPNFKVYTHATSRPNYTR